MKKIITTLSTLCFSAFLVACSAASKPEDVAKDYVKAAYDGNAEKMLSYIYVPEEVKSKPGTEEMVQGKIKAGAAKAKEEASRKGGVKEISILDNQIDEGNGQGQVTVETQFKNEGSTASKDRVKLIKNDDKWKVNI